MKKIMIVAALLATAAVSATPSFAAAAVAAPKVSPFVCFFHASAPGCADMMKDHKMMMPMFTMPVIKAPAPMKVAAPAKPMMPMMPNCTKAAPGAGHLLDCKM